MRYLLIILLFASCISQRKVSAYLDEHPAFAAQQCAIRFPIRDSTIVVVVEDSAGYEHTVNNLMAYADSISHVAELRNKAIRDVQAELNTIRSQKDYTDGELERLQAKLDNVKPVDISALRKSIEAEIRAKLKPCKDSIITNIQTDPRAAQLLVIAKHELEELYAGKKDLSTLFGWIMLVLIKKWWFWLIVVVFGGWVYWRIRAGALNSALSKLKKI